MTGPLTRRLGAVEKRLGVTGRPMEHLSDADLDAMIEWIWVYRAEQGEVDSIAKLAAGDDREAEMRQRHEKAGGMSLPPGPAVRWPYQRAEALRWEELSYYRGPRSARTDEELERTLRAVIAVIGARP